MRAFWMDLGAARWAGAIGAGMAIGLAAPAEARAHDYWLVPSVLVTPQPASVSLSLYVGDDFVAEEEKEMLPARVSRFVHVRGAAVADLLPSVTAGERPIASFARLDAGGHLFALDRTAARIELEAVKFESYLREEGLEEIVQDRAKRGESDRPGRERYERFLKALVQVGAARDDTHMRVLGQSLEIIPRSDPTLTAEGETLPVEIRFEGNPLARARLERLTRRDGRVSKAVVVTGPDGSAAVPMIGEGAHLLRLVHMVRCEGCEDADWRSYWAAYTFASRPADPTLVVTAPPMFGSAGLGGMPWGAFTAAGGLLVAALGLGWWLRRKERAA